MLADRLSEDGATQALGWPKARVTACVKLLELPERAQGSSARPSRAGPAGCSTPRCVRTTSTCSCSPERVDDYDIAELGKKATEQYAKACKLHKQLARYGRR